MEIRGTNAATGHRLLRCMLLAAVCAASIGGAGAGRATEPAQLVEVPAARMPPPGSGPPRAAVPPRNTGPEAMAHSRYRRGRHGTTRIIRRTPAVMREDAARVKRGDLFSTWSNEYLE
jgi:hypothetical protein